MLELLVLELTTYIKQSGSLANKDLVSSRGNNNINIEHITFDGNNITNSEMNHY